VKAPVPPIRDRASEAAAMDAASEKQV